MSRRRTSSNVAATRAAYRAALPFLSAGFSVSMGLGNRGDSITIVHRKTGKRYSATVTTDAPAAFAELRKASGAMNHVELRRAMDAEAAAGRLAELSGDAVVAEARQKVANIYGARAVEQAKKDLHSRQ